MKTQLGADGCLAECWIRNCGSSGPARSSRSALSANAITYVKGAELFVGGLTRGDANFAPGCGWDARDWGSEAGDAPDKMGNP